LIAGVRTTNHSSVLIFKCIEFNLITIGHQITMVSLKKEEKIKKQRERKETRL